MHGTLPSHLGNTTGANTKLYFRHFLKPNFLLGKSIAKRKRVDEGNEQRKGK